MYVRGLKASRFLLSVFQARLLSADPTVIEWFLFTPAICLMFWNDHSGCMCVHARVEWSPGHTLTPLASVRGFQSTSVRGSWRWRKVHLLWEPFGICFIWQVSITLFYDVLPFFFFFSFSPFYSIFHGWMEEGKVLLWINKDCLQLLHGASFAFLSFCVGPQELQPAIKPAPHVTSSQSWMRWAQTSHASNVSAHG